MREPNANDEGRLRVGSLFSGYGGLDVAVEHALNAETIWFSEINEPVAGVFTHHWPEAPNLGDITRINWNTVEPVDILCGGFPCQDVSTIGKRAGLAPGTRSGLWAHMATAIETLRPEWVVVENVRGLLSAPARRATSEGDDDAQRNPETATPDGATLRYMELDRWGMGDQPARPLRALGAVLGDLADLGMDAQWLGLPASLVGAPHPRLRVFILAHSQGAAQDAACHGLDSGRRNARSGTGEARDNRSFASDHRLSPERTLWLAQQAQRVGDVVVPDRRHFHRWGRYAHAIAQWEHITGRSAPDPAILSEDVGPRPSSVFVEWIMGLPEGWVTDPMYGLKANQQTTALGNGVLPVQAATALVSMMGLSVLRQPLS